MIVLYLSLAAVVAAQDTKEEVQASQVDFAHDILPVLKSACAKCHTNDVYKGGLSLETRAQLIDSGMVEVGSREDSELFARITSKDPELRMPPEGDGLSESQIEKFGDWIDGRLDWPDEISLKKLKFKRPLELRPVSLPASKGDQADASHPIDRLLDAYFEQNSVQHPAPISPTQFYRRAKLDFLGQLPTSDELGDVAGASELRSRDASKYIDDFLSRDRDYADHWLSFWNDLLRNDYAGTGYIDGGRKQVTQWLHRSLMENKGYDQFVRELINPASSESSGFIKGIKWRGKVNASQIEPLQFSQNISQVFLGINMKCASCHNSFIDDWKLEDAYGLAAITSDKPLELHRCDIPTGKMASSKFVFPQLGDIDQSLPRKQRLAKLAQLMVSKPNGRFSRTIVNRIWHRLIGRGLVHPVDMMGNEAWSESLLDYLANDLVENQYDLKRTLRLIATSRIYRSASVVVAAEPSAQAGGDDANDSDAPAFVFRGVGAKRLTAEQLVDAIWDLTQTAPERVDAAVELPGEPASGNWIWNRDSQQSPAGERLTFRYKFEIPSTPSFANVVVSCDNEFEVFLNGKLVGKGTQWSDPKFYSLLRWIKPGANELLVRARNGGESANPAALFLQGRVNFEADSSKPPSEINSEINFATDASWEFTKGWPKPQKIPDSAQWNPVVELKDAWDTYQPALKRIESHVARLSATLEVKSRASLVKSNDVMRSLGRPNREQVVTTRPEDLSTLQALNLSNGATLTGWLSGGAKVWLERKGEQQWSTQTMVSNLFLSALSRKPSDAELKLLLADAADADSDAFVQQQWVEDVLWMILMLPEFQFVK